jgi:hypothetical protein
VVLRPPEQQILEKKFPAFARQYRVVRRFAVSLAASRLYSWGVRMHNVDRVFTVLSRDRAVARANR